MSEATNVDCLLIGHNDSDFQSYVEMVRSGDAGAYRDLRLAFVEVDGRPMRALDALSHYHRASGEKQFHNTDFLSPGIAYLGTYLSRQGLSFDYVNAFQLEKDRLADKLATGSVRTVAILTTFYVSPAPISEIVSFVRQHDPSVPVIIGGPFIANQSGTNDEATLARLFGYLGGDYYVINQEGEATLARLLKALRGGQDLSSVPNIAYRIDGRFTRTGCEPEVNSLEDNQPDLSLFPPADVGQMISLRTAKSCPFSCSFCGFPQRAGKYVFESVEAVERELDAIRDLGTVNTLTFLDDTFNVPPKRFRAILEMMIRNDYGFRWNSFYRSDHGSAEIIDLMGQAGCEGVFLGIESGSDTMLKRMNKTARRQHYLAALPRLREAGISTYASLIIGFPGETMETVEETRDLLETGQPDFFRAQLWYCDPMTPIWQQRERYDIEGSAFNWSHATMDAATACAVIDDLFLSVEGSCWLPQWGFEQWSTFYLQRQGMSWQQVMDFVASFNTVVRENLLFHRRHSERPALLGDLERCSQFGTDHEHRPGLTTSDLWWPGRYSAAREFWSTYGSRPAKNTTTRNDAIGEPGWSSEQVQWPAAGDLDTRWKQPDVIVAAFAAALARWQGRSELTLLSPISASGEVGELAPLQLEVSRLDPDRVLHSMHEELASFEEHRPFALACLQDPAWLAWRGDDPPRFDTMVCVHRDGESSPSRERLDHDAPGIARQISIELTIGGSTERPELTIGFDPAQRHLADMTELGRETCRILSHWADGTEPVSRASLDQQLAVEAAVALDAEAAFSFDLASTGTSNP
ncbi:MAG: PhpK family radical SAM P-methyltransferase [Thermoanaerobaculia bacterium]|nr:PhpK family radical SAM P-methyltransferase [Thermoanaerobaculia bacterium]